jgi:hypothetical protein
MGVALDSHISSEMQRLQLVPIMQPFLLFYHPICCISPVNSSCAGVGVVWHCTSLGSLFPQVMPMWQHNVEVPVVAWPGTIVLLPT